MNFFMGSGSSIYLFEIAPTVIFDADLAQCFAYAIQVAGFFLYHSDHGLLIVGHQHPIAVSFRQLIVDVYALSVLLR